MAIFIIIKYATDNAGQKVNLAQSVAFSYTANQCGVNKQYYNSREEAQPDLEKMSEFNPTVDYGIAEVG